MLIFILFTSVNVHSFITCTDNLPQHVYISAGGVIPVTVICESDNPNDPVDCKEIKFLYFNQCYTDWGYLHVRTTNYSILEYFVNGGAKVVLNSGIIYCDSWAHDDWTSLWIGVYLMNCGSVSHVRYHSRDFMGDPPEQGGSDPVFIRDGDFVTGVTDYFLAGRGMDFDFARRFIAKRVFRPSDDLKSWYWSFGASVWTHSYNIFTEGFHSLVKDTLYLELNCGIKRFKKTFCIHEDSVGFCKPLNLDHREGILRRLTDTTFVYKGADLKSTYFSKGNHIDTIIYSVGITDTVINYVYFADSIIDRNGNRISLSYDNDTLEQITDAQGNIFTLKYNNCKITSLRCPDSTHIIYKYYEDFYDTTSEFIYESEKYHLTQVLRETPEDSLIVISRYYYDKRYGTHRIAVSHILNEGYFAGNDTSYAKWDSLRLGCDRVCNWFSDSSAFSAYQEIIEENPSIAFADTDSVISRAYFESYIPQAGGTAGELDSSIVYYWADSMRVASHDPYDTSFTPSKPTSGDYYIEKFDFDTLGAKTSVTLDGKTTKYGNYDSEFHYGYIVDPDTDTTWYEHKYYVMDNDTYYTEKPTKIKYQTGDSTLFYYHAPDANTPSFFLTDSTFDELGRKTKYYYDNNYNLDSLRYSHRYVAGVGTTNVTTDYTYNNKGNLTKIKDPRGNSTHFQYAPNDTGAYLTETWIDFTHTGGGQPGNADIVTKYKYDTDIGKVDTVIYYRDFPNDSSIVRYVYDVMNRLKETYYPDGTYDIFTYDKRGNLLKKQTEKNATPYFKIAYEYDAMDHLTRVEEYPDVGSDFYYTTLYKYNLNGDLIGFINANDTTGTSTKVKYTYDAGRLLKVEYPDTTKDSLGYYLDGNLKFKKDRKAKVVSYVYDDRNRLTRKRYFNTFAQYTGFPDSTPAETLAFSYDKVGNMVSMLDKNGTVSYSYDEMDRVDTLSCYQDIVITYEYDVGGNRKRLKLVNASTPATVYLNQTYPSYDEANRLKRTIAGTTSTDTFDFSYWDTGQIKKLDYPSGVKEQYKLTSRNFIDILTDSSGNNQLFKSDYKYNELGDRDSLIFKLTRPGPVAPITGTIAYKYDDLRRVTEAKYPRSIYNKTNKYTYDKTGNRKREIAGRDTTDYSYNKRNNQLTDEGFLKGYYYDDSGNMVKFNYGSGIDTLFYDFENRLEKFVEKSMTIPPTYDTLWFTYCGMAKRIRKIEKPQGQSPDTTSYAYDGMYAVCEFGGHLDLQSKYIYANGLLLARYDSSPADSHYYHHDGLGSIMGITNESGNVEQSYFYDEFGNSLGSWGSADNHYLYTGQEYDGSISGLYNLRARYYDRSIGRFVSEDPIKRVVTKNPINLNPYIYVSNNPINYIDPLGKDKEQCKPEQVNQELVNIDAAYYFCLRRLPYSWGLIENFKWLGSLGRKGHSCGDFVSAVMGCIYEEGVVGPCCELRYQSLIVHALLTLWCKTESESYRFKRFYDPWAQKIFPHKAWGM